MTTSQNAIYVEIYNFAFTRVVKNINELTRRALIVDCLDFILEMRCVLTQKASPPLLVGN